MNRPDNPQALIDALFEGEAAPEEIERLLGSATPEELDELAELVDTLARIDPHSSHGFELPGDERFRAARESVLARIAASRKRSASRMRWLPLAAALATFAVGLAIGRAVAPPEPQAVPELTLADLVAESARGESGVPTFRYSNLRLRETGDGSLALTVDVEAELDLVRPRNDVLVSDILADSLVTAESLGTRLKAVRHAGSSPRVHKALTTAVLDDPDVSVRLKALERLIEQDAASPETQETLLEVLASEESVAMRLLALEAIQDDNLGADLLDALDEDDGAALLWQAQERLRRRSL